MGHFQKMAFLAKTCLKEGKKEKLVESACWTLSPPVCPGCPQQTGVPCGEGHPQHSLEEGASSLEQDRILNNTELGNTEFGARQK